MTILPRHALVRISLWPVLMLCACVTAIVTVVAQPALVPTAPRLNVLFIMADDLNTDLSLYGGPARSPNIERLAARGVRFDRAYTQYPLCNPSRASLLTGRRPDATGVLANPGRNPMSPHFRETLPTATTLPQLFRTQGYVSARVGKMFHYGVPLDIGTSSLDDFKSWDFAVNPRGRDREILDRVVTLVPGQFGGTLSWLADEGEDRAQTDGLVASEAISLLERFAREQKPFFLGVGFYRPHTPYVAPRRYFDMYPTDRIDLPALSDDDRARVPKAAYQRATKPQDDMTDAQRREAIQAYYASTTFMDAQVGLVVQALERLGLADNTVVVFTSDHGYHLADHGLWQKPSLFERNARVPLVIAAPGRARPGATSRSLVELVDLYPTLADLAGLVPPDPLDGLSLVPVLDAPERAVRDAAFTQAWSGYSVRTDRWRYVEWEAGRDGRQLYDLAADPRETRNLADATEHAAVVSALSARLAAYRQTPR